MNLWPTYMCAVDQHKSLSYSGVNQLEEPSVFSESGVLWWGEWLWRESHLDIYLNKYTFY